MPLDLNELAVFGAGEATTDELAVVAVHGDSGRELVVTTVYGDGTEEVVQDTVAPQIIDSGNGTSDVVRGMVGGEIVEVFVSMPGPQGRPGPAGPPGISSDLLRAVLAVTEVIPEGGPIFELNAAPRELPALFVNGLRQSSTSLQLAGPYVLFLGHALYPGDMAELLYLPGAP